MSNVKCCQFVSLVSYGVMWAPVRSSRVKRGQVLSVVANMVYVGSSGVEGD
jgi:hypothetical protein